MSWTAGSALPVILLRRMSSHMSLGITFSLWSEYPAVSAGCSSRIPGSKTNFRFDSNYQADCYAGVWGHSTRAAEHSRSG